MPLPDAVEHSAFGRSRQHPVFARDDITASDKRPVAPARILIVEDDFLVAIEVEAALTEAGFEIVGVATSAEDAVGLAASQRPALVVMDIRLAGQRDGIDAALELFRDHGIRCVFATAHCDSDVRKRANPAVPLAWLQKPYTMVSLVETVKKALRDLGRGTR